MSNKDKKNKSGEPELIKSAQPVGIASTKGANGEYILQHKNLVQEKLSRGTSMQPIPALSVTF